MRSAVGNSLQPPPGEPTLSIGVPTFNQGAYLQETLDSLLQQSRTPLEIVVSENHCTDNTAEILERYGGQIRVVRPPEHLAMMANWNFLISRMRGEWVALLSSDDLALPNYVETLERGIATSRAAVLVRAGYQRIDASGKVTKTKRLRNDRPVTSPPDTLLEQLTGPNAVFGAFAVCKEAWERVGGFPEDCHLSGDWGFWLRLSPHGDFISAREPITKYRNRYRSVEAEKGRAALWARDDLHIFHHIIPEVAAQMDGIAPELLNEFACRKCFRRLSAASAILGREERGEIADLMRGWSRECGLAEVLERFERGEVLPRLNYGPVRRRLSRWVRSLGGIVGVPR